MVADPRTLAERERRAGSLADSVDDEDRGGIETGRIVGRGRMREVVRDELQRPSDPAPQNRAGLVTDLVEMLQEGRLPSAIEPPFGTKRRAAKPGIERVRHPIDLAGAEVRHGPDRTVSRSREARAGCRRAVLLHA